MRRFLFFTFLCFLNLYVNFMCSHHILRKAEPVQLFSQITDSHEVYAPDDSVLVEAAVQVELARQRMTKILGDAPPKIAFLLFNSNQELLEYDYSDLRKRKLPFMPWLTNVGTRQAYKLKEKAGVRVTRNVIEVPIKIRTFYYDSLAIWIVDKNTEKGIRVIVQNIQDGKYNEDFWPDDEVLELNGICITNSTVFDSLYSATPYKQEIKFKIQRENKQSEFILAKPDIQGKSVKKQIHNSNDKSEFSGFSADIIAHEAGHVFYSAYVNLKINITDRYDFKENVSEQECFYGHPQIPDWLDEAMAIFCEPKRMQQSRIAGLSKNTIPLKKFVKVKHPNLDDTVDITLFYQQAAALARYLHEKAGPGFIASLTIDSANGKDFLSCISKFPSLPQDFESLEADYKSWLDANYTARN